MHIWPNGTAYPCCLSTYDYTLGNTNKSSLNDLWNSDRMTTLRKNILEDKPTKGCVRCYEHEEDGLRSLRQNMNKDYSHLVPRTKLTNDDGTVDDIFMAYMDIRFSNICNMKCRTCGPELSSSWVDDAIATNRYAKDQPRILRIKPTLEQFWSDVKPWIDTVERIYFAGGEPLIMDEHYKILEHLIDIGKTDIHLYYNTNFSKLTYKKKDIVELWKYFKYVNVGASLDAMGKRAELMRSGTKWEDIENNRKRLLAEVPHVKFMISSTISAFNAEHCFDFFDSWIEKEWITPFDIDINILLFPEYQRMEILPLDNRKKIQKRAKKFLEDYDLINSDSNGRVCEGVKAIISTLEKDKEYLAKEFLKYNEQLDSIRNETLYEAFPELESLQ